jgi:hypothetical protein
MCHDLFFAADYDKNHDFHVNTWQEVKEHMRLQSSNPRLD